jgi:hypothetical protein
MNIRREKWSSGRDLEITAGNRDRDFELELQITAGEGRSAMRSIAKYRTVGIVAAAALVSVAWASDIWKDKKPADWTPKQLDKFMTSSPWSNTVQPDSNLPMSSGSPGGPGGGGYGGGGGQGGGGGRGGGGMGAGSGAAMPIMTFQIRWLSAPVMREALKVAEDQSLSAEVEKYASDYYIVGVQMKVEGGASGSGPHGGAGRGGLGNIGNGQGGASGAGQGQGASNEQAQTRGPQFQPMSTQGAILKFGHQQVHPEKAEIGPSKMGMMTLYMFPRSLKLEDADKSYLFEVTQGQSTTRASFSLKGLDEAQDKGL